MLWSYSGICAISIGSIGRYALALPGPSKMVNGGRSRTSQNRRSLACADGSQQQQAEGSAGARACCRASQTVPAWRRPAMAAAS
jgi:hypothetical protein